jgi:hypothetical protein
VRRRTASEYSSFSMASRRAVLRSARVDREDRSALPYGALREIGCAAVRAALIRLKARGRESRRAHFRRGDRLREGLPQRRLGTITVSPAKVLLATRTDRSCLRAADQRAGWQGSQAQILSRTSGPDGSVAGLYSSGAISAAGRSSHCWGSNVGRRSRSS